MLTKEVILFNRNRFVALLESTERKGIPELITYLDDEGFFEAPAAPGPPKVFHGCYYGGLCKHSLDVYDKLVEHVGIYKPQIKSGFGQMQLKFTDENLIIAGLLHDVCKINAYQRTKADDGFTNNRNKEKGHARLSLMRIQKFIKLDKIEMLMIKFHMGVYGCIEFQDEGKEDKGEYNIRGDHSACEGMTKEASKKFRYGKSMSNVWYHNPVCKVFSLCDELATLKEKADEA